MVIPASPRGVCISALLQQFVEAGLLGRRLQQAPEEAETMHGGDAMLEDCQAVFRCRIALVPCEAVAGQPGLEAAHDTVAGDLGKDARRRDRPAERVAVDQGATGCTDIERVPPVD